MWDFIDTLPNATPDQGVVPATRNQRINAKDIDNLIQVPVEERGAAANEPLLSSDRLWTSDDCAAFFQISRWTFVNRLSKAPGFPRPHVETSRRMRRWLPDDIRVYRTKRGR